MNSDPTVIVGAGSVGLILASNLSSEFNEILIHESTGLIGGIMQDFSNDKGDFFSHCQYLSGSYLPGAFKNQLGLNKFEHRYASLTNFDDYWIFAENFAGPTFRTFELSEFDPIEAPVSIHDQLALYPKPVREYLFAFLRKFTNIDLNLIHVSGLSSINMARISTLTNVKDLIELKQNNNVIDKIYGLPRHFIQLTYENCYMPTKGYQAFWSDYLNQLNEFKQIKILFHSKFSSNEILKLARPENINLKAWCADPRFLVNALTDLKLESINYKKFFYGLVVKKYSGPNLPYYINIFCNEYPITRLFFYYTESGVKLTVESISKFLSLSDIKKCLNVLIHETSISFEYSDSTMAFHQSRQYFPMTIKDFDLIKQLSKKLNQSNWLDTGLYFYNREKRLQMILNKVKKLKEE